METLIGEGGSAVVYRVRHRTLGTLHALKVVHGHHPALRARLVREGQLQAHLRHPNLVAVTDVLDVNGAPALLMDFVAGGNLDQRLAGGPVPFELADALALDLVEGVAAAHAAGVVHRDLKPANVLLDPGGQRLVAKVTDFGIARVLQLHELGASRSRTRSDVMMGTPAYASPEQIESARDADAQSDLFSLGAVLYELVSGSPAFSGAGVADVLYAVAHGNRIPLGERAPHLPARVIDAVEAALTVDRDARVKTAEDLRCLWTGEEREATAPGPLFGALVRAQARVSLRTTPTAVPLVSVSETLGGRPRPRTFPWGLGVIAVAALGAVAWRLPAREAPPVASFGPSSPENTVPAPERAPVALSSSRATETVTVAAPTAEAAPSVALSRPAVVTAPIAREPERAARPGRVDVVGAERVDLVRRTDGARVSPGPGVPPGVYDLVVRFAGEDPLPIELGIRVAAGDDLLVACDGDFYTCAPRSQR